MAVSLRLAPRTYYGLDVLARKRHTTLTSVVEWAIARAVSDSIEGLVEERDGTKVNMLDELWDVESSDRFVKLAEHYPSLLRFEEDQLWHAIKQDPTLWSAKSGARMAAIRGRWAELSAKYLSDST
jgi:hypothetical protein